MDPVSGNNAKNRQVRGALSLQVDDLLMTGDDVFEKEIMGRLRKDLGPKIRMVAFLWDNASNGSMTSTVGALMFTRTLPLTNFRRLYSTRT